MGSYTGDRPETDKQSPLLFELDHSISPAFERGEWTILRFVAGAVNLRRRLRQ